MDDGVGNGMRCSHSTRAWHVAQERCAILGLHMHATYCNAWGVHAGSYLADMLHMQELLCHGCCTHQCQSLGYKGRHQPLEERISKAWVEGRSLLRPLVPFRDKHGLGADKRMQGLCTMGWGGKRMRACTDTWVAAHC